MTQNMQQHYGSAQSNGVAKPAVAADAPLAATTLPGLCVELRRKVLAFLEEPPEDETVRRTQEQTRISLQVVEEALKRYKFDELSLSYNGGKDCLCLLVLLLACFPDLGPAAGKAANGNTAADEPLPTHPPIQAIYIAPTDPFSEVEEFVTTSTRQYHLDLMRYELAMRPALDAYLEDRKSVKAIFMGTRRTDPHSEFLEHFSPTDKGWPQFMRINPVIDWHYVDIWNFIRKLGIPYCSLYDLGYTSLGGTSNTKPNPKLALDAEGTRFRPAHELVNDEEERLGRVR